MDTGLPCCIIFQTGWGGVTKYPQSEIIYLCCTLEVIENCNSFYVFTDGHAKTAITKFYKNKGDLIHVDWNVVYAQQWNNSLDDIDRMRRKQAEFLVRKHVPKECIKKIVTYDENAAGEVLLELERNNLDIEVLVNPKGKFYY